MDQKFVETKNIIWNEIKYKKMLCVHLYAVRCWPGLQKLGTFNIIENCGESNLTVGPQTQNLSNAKL